MINPVEAKTLEDWMKGKTVSSVIAIEQSGYVQINFTDNCFVALDNVERITLGFPTQGLLSELGASPPEVKDA